MIFTIKNERHYYYVENGNQELEDSLLELLKALGLRLKDRFPISNKYTVLEYRIDYGYTDNVDRAVENTFGDKVKKGYETRIYRVRETDKAKFDKLQESLGYNRVAESPDTDPEYCNIQYSKFHDFKPKSFIEQTCKKCGNGIIFTHPNEGIGRLDETHNSIPLRCSNIFCKSDGYLPSADEVFEVVV